MKNLANIFSTKKSEDEIIKILGQKTDLWKFRAGHAGESLNQVEK